MFGIYQLNYKILGYLELFDKSISWVSLLTLCHLTFFGILCFLKMDWVALLGKSDFKTKS